MTHGCLRFALGVLFSMVSTVSLAGYGIDCEAPTVEPGFIQQDLPFSFTCENNTIATFSSFRLTANQVSPAPSDEGSAGAEIVFNIVWPNGSGNIKPGDVGTVTGTLTLPQAGNYAFDFDKSYGGETFEGIFCGNGKTLGECVNTAGSQLAAVTDGFGEPVFAQCPVDSTTGHLSVCEEEIDSVFGRPIGLGFATVSGQYYVYVVDADNSGNPVARCPVDATGSIISDNCINMTVGGSDLTNWYDIVFYPSAIEPEWAYVADGDLNVWWCPIQSDGTFSSCAIKGPDFENGPANMSVQDFNGQPYLYVADGNFGAPAEQVWKCAISTSTGDLAPCVDSGAGALFDGPIGIAFASVSSGTYAYVTNWQDDLVTRCTVDVMTGLLNAASCTTIFSSPTVAEPLGIKIIPINGALQAYIVDGGAFGSQNILQCSIEESGDLNNCQSFNNNGNFFGIFEIDFWPPI